MRNNLILLATTLLTACAAQPDTPLALEPITTNQNTMDHAVLEGRILDENAQPLANVNVKLFGGFATRWEVGQTKTGPDGTFRFDPFEGAGSTIERDATWMHYVGITLDHATHASIDANNWWDIVVPKTGTTRRDFTFAPAGSVSGVITDPQGQPIAHGLRLRLGVEHNSTFWKYADTEVDGAFRVSGLHPGVYLLDLNGSDTWLNEVGTFEVRADQTTTVAFALVPASTASD